MRRKSPCIPLFQRGKGNGASPLRINFTSPVETSTIVDPFDGLQDLPLTIPSILSPNCSRTSLALEHEGNPDKLALVAVIAPPTFWANCLAFKWGGMRMPMVPVLAVRMEFTFFLALKIKVTLPGHTLFISFLKEDPGCSTQFCSSFKEEIMIETGFPFSRPLIR